MSTVILVPKYTKLGEGFSRSEQREANFHPGRRTDGSQTAASWLADLSDLRKLITLCGFCATKFNPRRNGYRRWYAPDHTGNTSGHTVSGVCDACKSPLVANGVAFIAAETYNLVCIDPVDARRQARMKARAAWTQPRLRTGSRRPNGNASTRTA